MDGASRKLVNDMAWGLDSINVSDTIINYASYSFKFEHYLYCD